MAAIDMVVNMCHGCHRVFPAYGMFPQLERWLPSCFASRILYKNSERGERLAGQDPLSTEAIRGSIFIKN